jgi:hypothetical protein
MTYSNKTEEYKNINKYKKEIQESLNIYNHGNNTNIITRIIDTLNTLYCYVEYNKEPYWFANNIYNIYENIDKININVYNFYIVVQIIRQLIMYKPKDYNILKFLLKSLLPEDTHADKVDTNTEEYESPPSQEHEKQELKQHEPPSQEEHEKQELASQELEISSYNIFHTENIRKLICIQNEISKLNNKNLNLRKIENIMKDLNINMNTLESIIKHNYKKKINLRE